MLSENDPLPVGTWTVGEHPLPDARLYPAFHVVAVEPIHQDRVQATVYVGDIPYLREDWGIPDDLDPEHVWHLNSLENRRSKARGGTTSLLRHLTSRADAAESWLLCEVYTARNLRDAEVIGFLKRHGGFVRAPSKHCDRLLVRLPVDARPETSSTRPP